MRGRADAFVILRGDERNLAPVDFRLQVAHSVVIDLVGGDAFQGAFHKFEGVPGYEWHGSPAHVRPDLAELVQRRGVEGRGFDIGRDVELRQSAAHFRSGLDGEGYGEGSAWIPGFGGARVGDSTGDGPGFARSCTCDDADGSPHRTGGRALRIVQSVEKLLRCCTHVFHCGRLADGRAVFAFRPRFCPPNGMVRR